MRKGNFYLSITGKIIYLLAVLSMSMHLTGCAAPQLPSIVIKEDAFMQEKLASIEVRRYVYLRTGQWLPIVNERPGKGDIIVLLTDESLDEQQYRLKKIHENDREVLNITGGSGVAVLYGAYHFAELIGIRFYLHGDVIPDEKIGLLKLPDIDETFKPLFELRGLNPWGSHVEGIDLWNTDDWKRVFTQMTKMRMNFLGVHSYPEHPKPGSQYDSESTVWIGRPEDINDNGKVIGSFPSSLYNTMRSQWGHRPKKTGDFAFGASQLFEYDEWGPESMIGYCPMPETEEGCNEVFNRTGAMQRDAFHFAKQLGVKTCVGTESPLTIPRRVKGRLIEDGKDPSDPEVIKEIYRGIFERIAKTHSLDYYWIWTPEKWLWSLNSEKETEDFVSDINIAIQAWKEVNPPFELATSGWVLGPVEDRAALDRLLPSGMAVSALSEAYSAPVDPAFKDINKRPKWAIPWLEEDNGILGPQLWVSRARKDAADALSYGCNGLMGLLWRTRPTGPASAALAKAGWSQKGWNMEADNVPPGVPPSIRYEDILPPYGRDKSEVFNVKEPVEGAEEHSVYSTYRTFLRGYRLKIPSGKYKVTLMFCEPECKRNGDRVFDVKLQDKMLMQNLDIFKDAGLLKALELTNNDVIVDDGWLDIVLEPKESEACISGIIIENEDFQRKINCGGYELDDFEGDPLRTKTFNYGPKGTAHIKRGLPCDDFYYDWAEHHFGEDAGKEIGEFFAALDGNIPTVSAFDGGAGALWPDEREWKNVAPEFKFVDEFESFHSLVNGKGNIGRYNYWLNTFYHLRTQAETCCLWSRLNVAIANADLEKSLELRKGITDLMGKAYGYLLATVSTPGGMATVLNWECHIGKRLTDPVDDKLEELLGSDLPDSILPYKEYRGLPRIIVPTIRTSICEDEDFILKVIKLSEIQSGDVAFYWRELGSKGKYKKELAKHISRGVYSVELDKDLITDDFEYYIESELDNEKLIFPITAPGLNQTVVVFPASN